MTDQSTGHVMVHNDEEVMKEFTLFWSNTSSTATRLFRGDLARWCVIITRWPFSLPINTHCGGRWSYVGHNTQLRVPTTWYYSCSEHIISLVREDVCASQRNLCLWASNRTHILRPGCDEIEQQEENERPGAAGGPLLDNVLVCARSRH